VNLLDKKSGLWAALALRCRAAHLLPVTALTVVGASAVSLLTSSPAYAQGSGTLTGTILDTATKRPIPDVVVTATSPALQGEQTVVTDSSGSYRIPNLPPGDYNLRLEGDGYKPYGRGGITMRLDTTIRVNAELLPEGLKAEEVVVVGKAPTVDVGSSSTGVSINQEFINKLALSPPGGKGAASRSFENLAIVAPGAQIDTYGVSLQGTTSPENAFLIDGVSVSDPAFGILGTPLSQEFFKEVNVITGGYLPEYGKAIGGIYDAVLKSGGNEFHGTAWFNITPGVFNGPIKTVQSAGSTEATTVELSSLRDFGADLGGPIIKDKLWFYAGIQSAFTTDNLVRNVSAFKYTPVTANSPADVQCNASNPNYSGLPNPNNLPCEQPVITGTGANAFPAVTLVKSNTYLATQTAIQYIAKLTYLINQDHKLTLSVYGTPTTSGGNGNYAFGTQTNAPPGDLLGVYSAIGNQVVNTATDVSLKYSGAFNNKRQLLDVTVGYHHENQATKAADGSSVDQIGQAGTQANIPNVFWRANTPNPNLPNVPGLHSITDFENVPGGLCGTVYTASGGLTPTCPLASGYTTGGPGFIDDIQLDSYQAKGVFTDLLQAAGHHVIKIGVNVNLDDYIHDKGYSGSDAYQESSTIGGGFVDIRQYGFLSGPDTAVVLNHYVAKTTTWSLGGFAQDSWQILDKVTLNFGLRYDAQILYGADGEIGMALPNQVSPRVGIVYDFTQQGRSKLFANYGRYFEGVPLDAADRSFPSEPQIQSFHPGCTNPLAPGATSPGGNCSTSNSTLAQIGSTNNPNQLWNNLGASKEPADPHIQPQSSDEFVVGGEYEIFADARLGLTYTHRDLHRAIEDMSRDEANTYFIGNPGYGIATDFPKAVRNYDAGTVYFQKTYANTWLLIASYTLSRLYGNYSGLFVPETGQLDPNITADFDLKSLLPNTTGPLPGDHTHQIKLYGAKDFLFAGNMDALLGVSYRGRSGSPESALGAHPLYGQDNVYIVPRGQGGTLAANGESIVQERSPWVHDIDLRVGYAVKLSKDTTLGITVDIYNIFDFQAATLDDPTYTTSNVLPCKTGTAPSCIVHSDGSPFNAKLEVNPNYGKPLAYQDPRQWRLGAKVTF
jgi:hypothetical protein